MSIIKNNSQRAFPETERSLAATSFDGTDQNIGTALANVPVIVVFDNQTDVTVPLYVDGILFKTFLAKDVFPLDLRANHGMAANFAFDKGTQFSTNASVGTEGSMRISVLYAR